MEAPLLIEGFLIDMDGLLLDTERLSRRCWEVAEEETGFRMPNGYYPSLIGLSMATIRERLECVMVPECNVDQFLEVAGRIYTESLMKDPVPVKEGAHDLLRYLSQQEWPRCLATSTGRRLCDHKLKSSGLAEFLPLSVCGDEVGESKPAPDIYLNAARRLGGPPQNLLVLEDSENGLRAALAAGCRTAHVPDIGPVSTEVQARVDRVYRGLPEVLASLQRGEIRRQP